MLIQELTALIEAKSVNDEVWSAFEPLEHAVAVKVDFSKMSSKEVSDWADGFELDAQPWEVIAAYALGASNTKELSILHSDSDHEFDYHDDIAKLFKKGSDTKNVNKLTKDSGGEGMEMGTFGGKKAIHFHDHGGFWAIVLLKKDLPKNVSEAVESSEIAPFLKIADTCIELLDRAASIIKTAKHDKAAWNKADNAAIQANEKFRDLDKVQKILGHEKTDAAFECLDRAAFHINRRGYVSAKNFVKKFKTELTKASKL